MSKPHTKSLADYAIQYARAGLYVFPITENTKHDPLVAWGSRATTDEATIRAWWKRWPTANIGLACMPSGLVAIDIDRKPGKDGFATLDKLALDGKQLTPTRVHTTPGGGEHHIYKGTAPSSESHIGADLCDEGTRSGIDTRGTNGQCGGYIVLPPSVIDGKAYAFKRKIRFAELPALDPWVIEELSKVRVGASVEQTPAIELDQPQNVAWCIEWLKKHAPVSKQYAHGDEVLVKKVAPILKDRGISEERAAELLIDHWNDRCEPPWKLDGDPADNLYSKVHNAYLYCTQKRPGEDTAEAEFASEPLSQDELDQLDTGRPTVIVRQGRIPEAIEATYEHLRKLAEREPNHHDRVFARGTELVRLNRYVCEHIDNPKADRYRENNALITLPVSAVWLQNTLDKRIRYMSERLGKAKKDGTRSPMRSPMSASPDLAKKILEDCTTWNLHGQCFGPLNGTIEAPTLRKDGSILDVPGYDAASGLYFDPNGVTFPKVPEHPTFEQGKLALANVESILVDFPFKDADDHMGTSKAVALAAILTAVVRRTLDAAPAFATTAKKARSGKSLLSQIKAALMCGRAVIPIPLNKSEEERRKQIGTMIYEGRPVLLFGNCDKVTIEGNFLENLITEGAVRDRLLSTNKSYAAYANCLILFNGNNLTVAGAMTEDRVLMCRLEPDQPLGKRKFTYPDLLGHVIANRPALVVAALTALRAWELHGVKVDRSKPKAGEVSDGDEREQSRLIEWDQRIAQALTWYGYADPARGVDALKADDPVEEAKREAMRELSAVVKIGKPFMARDLASHQRVIHSFALLRDVPPRDMNAILLGHCLTSLTGEQIVGFTLRESKPKQGTKTYVLEGCQGEVEQPPDAAADFLDAAE